MVSIRLRRVAPEDIPEIRRDPVDAKTLDEAAAIVEDVRRLGAGAVRHHAVRLGDLEGDRGLFVAADELRAAYDGLDGKRRQVLHRTAERIDQFATAQRHSIEALEVPISGGVAGHRVIPVERAGCYAPGGRFPLPSSVLMTAVTARAAGVEEVWVASPNPTEVTLAAAWIAGVDGMLRVGGAQAIAAMAYGIDGLPACDAVVGPGNRWVTAAKQLVSGFVRIDMLAGPSELVVLADPSADPRTVAADLLAQAEHDVDALPILVTTSEELIGAVEHELDQQLADLSTAMTARAALDGGFAVAVKHLEEGIAVCNRIAPEHLEIVTENAEDVASKLRHFGGLFVGANAAEVLGDYGAGPNHTLPTGGTARSQGGLSVFDFLKISTWMRIDDLQEASQLVEDAVELGKMEGLEAHARSAALRQSDGE